MLDNVVVGGLTWFVVGAVMGVLYPAGVLQMSAVFRQPFGAILDGMATAIVVIPGNAVIIGLTGLSVGKWLFGVKVVTRAGRPIGVGRALAREVRVWIMGLGLGVPLVSFITLVMAFSRLQDRRATAWDEDQRNRVVHRPFGAWQVLLFIVGLVLTVSAVIALRPSDLQRFTSSS